MTGRDILLFWILAFCSGTHCCSKFTFTDVSLEVVFLSNILRIECSISLQFYVDKRKTHKFEFWINGFFLSNETILGEFQIGLGIVWVMKPREREREREREIDRERERRSQIREKKGFELGNNSWLSSRVSFHKFQIQIFLFLKFSVSPMTWRTYC